uniref:c-type cytochrome domain-containing protein n=1 Tax=Maribacter sp. TaxID=1897614 RepID=UPI0025B96052
METSNWILQLLGRLHPLLVHFPIGLLVVSFVLELLTLKGKRNSLREGIKFMVYIGAFFAILSAIVGWLLKTQEDYAGNLVDNHQYTGIATAVLALATALILNYSLRKSKKLTLYRSIFTITIVLLSVAGHLGANLTHGEDYLTAVLPSNNTKYDNENTVALLQDLKSADSLSILQKDKLNLEVRGIFAHKCYQCHGENKKKGELVLENKAGVFKGGETGLAVVPGNAKESEIYKRIILPAGHKDVMPTKGKLLTADEIELVRLWIDEGAHWSDQALKVFPEAE